MLYRPAVQLFVREMRPSCQRIPWINDYIFTDPPFGSNIFYADCSILWEAWLQDFTDVKQEAVWNKSLKPEEGGKTLEDYAAIMAKCFEEMYRVLKPGRWASVVFSNRDDLVWQ